MHGTLRQFWARQTDALRTLPVGEAIGAAKPHGISLRFDREWLGELWQAILTDEGVRERLGIGWELERFLGQTRRELDLSSRFSEVRSAWMSFLLFRAENSYSLLNLVTDRSNPLRRWRNARADAAPGAKPCPIRVVLDIPKEHDPHRAEGLIEKAQASGEQGRSRQESLGIADCRIVCRSLPVARSASWWSSPIAGAGARMGARRSFGTLGGLVQTSARVCFGVTCSHVLPDSDPPRIFGPPGALGRSRRAGVLLVKSKINRLPQQPVIPCGIAKHPDASPSDVCAFRIDRSLLESAGAHHEAHSLDTVSSLCQDQEVTFRGARSGSMTALVANAHIAKAFRLPDGGYFVLNDLIEIKQQGPAYVLQKAARRGDSGSWVMTHFPFYAWAGMIVGVDTGRAYCLQAEQVLSTLEAGLGPLKHFEPT